MLIEKKIDLNDVATLRLISGEELIGKIVAMDDESITLLKPVLIQIQMVAQNQAGIVFGPFMASSDDDVAKFKFPKKNLLCDPLKTRADVKAQYIKATTRLDIAPSLDLKVK